ncbi:hypothetical protein [Pelosinus baikalensis]|uniref:Uncharacterized protein n=1 Tax=Pelosinus baikalensis TaxID=2892015 RepID=A0ABS8HTB5_9FIRM|nr:hypothetical protein [Pelosinus baikalensis]MCC5466182.1 hypothetical protein [Pelosinus baikalensis]
MEFHEKVEFLIKLLQENNNNSYDEEVFKQLEKLLEEYARNYKPQRYAKNAK